MDEAHAFFAIMATPLPSLFLSVADPGCLSRILIFIHPGYRIPDPTTAPKEKGKILNR